MDHTVRMKIFKGVNHFEKHSRFNSRTQPQPKLSQTRPNPWSELNLECIPWVIISTEASSGTLRIGDNFIK